MNTTRCLLKSDPEFLFAIVNITMFYLYCEMLENNVNIYV